MRSARCWRGLAFDLALLERGQAAPAAALRGGAPLYAVRPAARLRADPARNVAHRQGRPQIRLLPRRRQPASRRARSDHPVAMLDGVCHAARQRAGPGDHPLGNRQFVRLDAVVPVVDGSARGDRLRRRRRHHHAAEIRGDGPAICCPAPARSSPAAANRARPATSTWPRSSSGCAMPRKHRPPASSVGEPVSPVRQAGEPEYRRPSLFQSDGGGDKTQRTGMVGFRAFRD